MVSPSHLEVEFSQSLNSDMAEHKSWLHVQTQIELILWMCFALSRFAEGYFKNDN